MKPLIILSIISSYLFYSSDAEADAQAVNKLIKKICNIARDKLHIHTASPKDREMILESLKSRFKNRSELLGIESTAHIRLIIQGLTILSLEDNYKKMCLSEKINTADRRILYDKMQIVANDPNHFISVNNSDIQNIFPNSSAPTSIPAGEDIPKTEVIKPFIDKMDTILKTKLENVSTVEEKWETVNKLKHQFTAALRRVFNNSTKQDVYINLAEQGMDLAVDKILNKTLIPSQRSKLDDSTLIGQEALAKVSQTEQLKKNLAKVPQPKHVFSSSPAPLTSTTAFPGVTTAYNCLDVVKDTCARLKQLDKFACEYDSTTLNVHQVCDGNVDCPDGADEKNCIQQVIGKIHTSTQIMAKVEMSQSCFRSIINNDILSKQGKVLSSLLNSQVDFLKKYALNGLHLSSTESKDAKMKHYSHQSITEIASEVGIIVRSFASTLIGALCLDNDRVQKDINDFLGANIDKEFEEMQMKAQTVWMPSSCQCEKQYCNNMTSCEPQCKRFCYQFYSLQNFNCRSIKKGENIIPLDFVCDGKLDCIDETDELNCPGDNSQSKFDGNRLFGNTIHLIKMKTMTQDYASVRVEMVELQVCIQNLQKRSVMATLDIAMVKHNRDKCFRKLADIYEIILQENELPRLEKEVIYSFMSAVNENLISAMKHTHLGNKNIISSEDCICNGVMCAQVYCQSVCIKACLVKALMTSYNCSSSGGNTTVPIDSICDGKFNCPNAEDEINCKPDICRNHHLKVIRKNINSICDQQYHGSSIGEDLAKWRTKMESNLIRLGIHERLTPQIIKHSVAQLLNNLALTYGSMEAPRRQDIDKARQKKFITLSQQILELLKVCNR